MVKFLVITQVVYVLFTGPWLVFWLMSFMMFDAGTTWLASTMFSLITLLCSHATLRCSLLRSDVL